MHNPFRGLSYLFQGVGVLFGLASFAAFAFGGTWGLTLGVVFMALFLVSATVHLPQLTFIQNL